MRGSIGCVLLAVLGLGCTAPPVPESIEATIVQPPIVFADVPPPPKLPEPERPLGFVGQNPGCPTLKVFTSVEDLCERGLMPMHPYGWCQRLRLTEDEESGGLMSADRIETPAMDGIAELIVHERPMYGGLRTIAVVALALRGANGLVLLGYAAHFRSHEEWAPELEDFHGDATSVEIRTVHQPWTPEGDEGEEVYENLRCTLGEGGSIRCNDECPQLALHKPLPALDCAALEAFDWSELPRGTQDDGYDYDEWKIAGDWLGIEPDEEDLPVRYAPGDDTPLIIFEPKRGHFALLHGEVPLLASRRAIRVGPAPGGVFVSSWSEGERRIHRLNLATHELEPVLPGRCG